MARGERTDPAPARPGSFWRELRARARSAPARSRVDAIAHKLLLQGRDVVGHLHVGRQLRARAALPGVKDRPFLVWEGRVFTYADTYAEAKRFAALFRRTRHELGRRGEMAATERLVVGIYRDNSPSYVFAVLGAALDGDVVVAVNTGFRGDTLEALLAKAEVRLLIVGEEQQANVASLGRTVGRLAKENILVDGAAGDGAGTLAEALAAPAPPEDARHTDGNAPLLVIYTSGTTAAPKGIGCSHVKLLGAGLVTCLRTGLRPSDRGYVCMPLFHSNAWYLGIMPLFLLGGSFVLKRRFSASAFEGDILANGVTYMSYVGQPFHYVLEALERKYGSGAAVEAALAHHPQNHFRLAHGNGATATDRAKLTRYLGMHHVYELYGSTEAVINTVVKPGDPIESVGRVTSAALVILNDRGEECPPAIVDGQGRITNYDAAVGEICARTRRESSLLFDGYYGDTAATRSKYRNGHYHSGDLGHIQIVGGKRYLYFDGRTDDWIRKDGENFSAESVARFAREEPNVAAAAAYGVPAAVSDEWVAVALELKDGATFDPAAFYERFVRHQKGGGLDPKWMPDFVRIVDRMPMTGTEKVLVRQLKREGYDLSRDPSLVLYFRRRGEEGYRRMTKEDYASLVGELTRNGRANLLQAF